MESNKGDFTLYMDARTHKVGISDADGNIIIPAEYDSKEDIGYPYDVLVGGEGDNMSIEEKQEFLDDYGIETLSVCENCGKFIHEGYTLAGEHACSDECAIQLYRDKDGNVYPNAEEIFRQDIEDNSDDCYWTAWEG